MFVSSAAELRALLPSVTSLDQLAARALDDGRIPLFVELDGRAIPTIPLLGQQCAIAFGRVASPIPPRPGQRALDQPFLAGDAPVIMITVPARDHVLVDLKVLEAMDGLQVVQLPELGGMTMYAFVGFAGDRPVGVLAMTEPPERAWPRLHQIEALAIVAGCARFFIAEHDAVVTGTAAPSTPSFLVEVDVRVRPTVVEPTVDHWPGVGMGFRLPA